MHIFPIHRYFDSNNSDFAGNNLIEFVKPLDRDDVEKLLSAPVRSTAKERADPVDLRIQYCSRLLRYFMPLPEQVDFVFNVWSQICQAYSRWNPSSQSAQDQFYDMIEALHAKTYEPRDDLTLFDSPLCITQIGTPGCGKSEIIRRFFRVLGRDGIFHHVKLDVYQLLALVVEAPNATHEKALAWLVYSALYAALMDTGATHPPMPRTASATELGWECAVIARKLNLGVIVVDEIQHCVHFSKGLDSHSMEFLTAFINRVRLPVLLIGTWKAVALLSSELRLGRRATNLASRLVRAMRPGAMWDLFVQGMMGVQYTSKEVAWSPEYSEVFHEYSCGVPDVAIKLNAITQMDAIAEGAETIDIARIKACAERHLPYVSPAVVAMRAGASETDVMIWDAEPDDFESWYARLQAECLGRTSAAARRKGAADASKVAKAAKLSEVLRSLGLASEQGADAIASQAVAADPRKDAAELAQQAIARLTRRGPHPTKSVKKMADMDRRFTALVPEDIRRVVYFANREDRNPQEALFQSGHLVDVSKVVPL